MEFTRIECSARWTFRIIGQTWSCRLKIFPLDLLRMLSGTRKHLAFVGNQVLNRFLMPTHAMVCTSAVIARWTIEHDVHATLPEWPGFGWCITKTEIFISLCWWFWFGKQPTGTFFGVPKKDKDHVRCHFLCDRVWHGLDLFELCRFYNWTGSRAPGYSLSAAGQ